MAASKAHLVLPVSGAGSQSFGERSPGRNKHFRRDCHRQDTSCNQQTAAGSSGVAQPWSVCPSAQRRSCAPGDGGGFTGSVSKTVRARGGRSFAQDSHQHRSSLAASSALKHSSMQDSRHCRKRFPNKAHSDMDKISKLTKDFRLALRTARKHKHFIFLDLFAGVQGISSQLRNEGCACLHFEITIGPEYDLCNHQVKQLIRGWASSHCLAGVWLATPCTTWTRARREPANPSWGPH